MHRNPVTAGLVERPEEWRWSSCNNFALDPPWLPTVLSRLISRFAGFVPGLKPSKPFEIMYLVIATTTAQGAVIVGFSCECLERAIQPLG
jgi:hypothetical protein